MARAHADFIETADQDEVQVEQGAWFGSWRRLLSEDDETHASTAVHECYPYWSADFSKASGLLEILVIEGDVVAHGQRLGRGGYLRAEDASQVQGLQSLADTRLLVMADPSYEPPGGPGDVLTIDTERLPYTGGVRGGPAGIAVKVLWDDQTRGPVSLIASNVARYGSGPEFHSCPEEIFVLAGDVTGRAGTMTADSYFWRPEFINHGPYWSESGLTVFLRGFGDLYAYWHDDAGATPEENRANLPRFQAEREARAAAESQA